MDTTPVARMTPLDFACERIGTKEIPGRKRNNPDIVVQFARCGHPEVTDDETYWCAAEVGGDLVQAGYPCSRPRAENLMARSYTKYGLKVAKRAKAIQAALDAGHTVIAVWPRGAPPAGHVNFVKSVDAKRGIVGTVDGNVSDSVGEREWRIKDAVAFRMPRPKLPHNIDKRLSAAGAAFIKEDEEADGKPALRAYDDGTGEWTIGWGSTDGVRKGMRISAKQAQALFDYEIVACEDAVHRLITRPISQGLFDALVSFFYNCGWGACDKLIAAVNSGDEAKIRSAWMLFVHARNANTGRLEVWPGLVKRRHDELALWSEIDAAKPEAEAELEKWAPAEAPPKPGVKETLSILASSKRMWAQGVAWVLMLFGYLLHQGQMAADWLGSIFGAAPDIVGDAQVHINAAEQMAAWFKLNWSEVCIWAAAAALTVAIIRHSIDKREGNA